MKGKYCTILAYFRWKIAISTDCVSHDIKHEIFMYLERVTSPHLGRRISTRLIQQRRLLSTSCRGAVTADCGMIKVVFLTKSSKLPAPDFNDRRLAVDFFMSHNILHKPHTTHQLHFTVRARKSKVNWTCLYRANLDNKWSDTAPDNANQSVPRHENQPTSQEQSKRVVERERTDLKVPS